MEEDQVIKHVTAMAYLDRFGVLHDEDGNRILLRPGHFDISHKIRIQELLRSPQYKMLKKLDGEVSSSEPERSPPAESALSNGKEILYSDDEYLPVACSHTFAALNIIEAGSTSGISSRREAGSGSIG